MQPVAMEMVLLFSAWRIVAVDLCGGAAAGRRGGGGICYDPRARLKLHLSLSRAREFAMLFSCL